MLHRLTIAKINRQIEEELRLVDRAFATHQEKMEALERVAALKALFDSPTETETESTTDSLVHEICEILRTRRR